ncbi:MAG: hypothetical protein WCR87_09290 [Saccharofermentanales bacterium]
MTKPLNISKIAEKYPDMEPWKVELLYNLSGQDEDVTKEACWILSNEGASQGASGEYILNISIDTLEDQINLILYARNIIRMRNMQEILFV